MKSLNQYQYSCTEAMFTYLKDSDLDKLITKLNNIELHAKNTIENNQDKNLWFKFGDDDTLATTIESIKVDLSNGNKNKELLIECFELVIGIEPKNGLKVFFS
jgi:hypothetical protein